MHDQGNCASSRAIASATVCLGAAHRGTVGGGTGYRGGVLDFVEECASFPKDAYDDQVEAWSQGGIYVARPIIEPNIRCLDVDVPSGIGPFEAA
jgi:hypothetical protein